MKTKKLNKFLQLLREENDLANVVAPLSQPTASAMPTNISLDAKIDRFIMQFERDAGPSPSTMGEGRRVVSLKSFLFEADDDDKKPEGDDPTGNGGDEDPTAAGSDSGSSDDLGDLGDLGGSGGSSPFGGGGGGGGSSGGMDDLMGGDDGSDTDEGSDNQSQEMPSVITPRININIMAQKVAQFVNNYEQQLDPKTVILRRVQAYLQQNYNETVANEFMMNLKNNFKLAPRSTAEEGQQTGMTQANYSSGAGIGDLSANPSSVGGTS
jgi:hypothetical protein